MSTRAHYTVGQEVYIDAEKDTAVITNGIFSQEYHEYIYYFDENITPLRFLTENDLDKFNDL